MSSGLFFLFSKALAKVKRGYFLSCFAFIPLWVNFCYLFQSLSCYIRFPTQSKSIHSQSWHHLSYDQWSFCPRSSSLSVLGCHSSNITAITLPPSSPVKVSINHLPASHHHQQQQHLDSRGSCPIFMWATIHMELMKSFSVVNLNTYYYSLKMSPYKSDIQHYKLKFLIKINLQAQDRKVSALQTGPLVNQTKRVLFLLDSECFTLAWQTRPPGGSSKTPSHTATKEVHLARLLPGLSWPTLKPRLHNQQAELAWPSSTSHPAGHHILSP